MSELASTGPDPAGLEEARRQAQQSLERAVGAGSLSLADYTQRVGVVWSAGSRGEIERVLGDLSQPLAGSGSAARAVMVSVFGAVKRRGRWRLRGRTLGLSLFGSIRLDLRGAVIDEVEVFLSAVSVFGDIDVVVPEGVEVELSGFDGFGDRDLDLAPVARAPGTPRIRVRAFTLFGDVVVHSEPPSTARA